MPAYFDPTQHREMELNTKTVLYLIEIKPRSFILRSSPQKMHLSIHRIDAKLLLNLSVEAYAAIFPHNKLRIEPLNVREIQRYLNIDVLTKQQSPTFFSRTLKQVKTFVKHVHQFYQSDHSEEKPGASAKIHHKRMHHYGHFFSPLTLFALKNKYPEAYQMLTELAANDGLTQNQLLQLTKKPQIELKLELALKYANDLITLVKKEHIPLESLFNLEVHQLEVVLTTHAEEKKSILAALVPKIDNQFKPE